MNYEKKYNEALERAKELYSQHCAEWRDEDIEYIFPELVESEDERIRKGIFKALSKKDARDVLISQGVEVSDALTWLEKQGDQISSTKVKPRFNSGDWVAQKMLHSPLRIVDVSDIEYRVEDVEGNSGVPKIDFLDRNYHLWAIQDAKDGDVLATENFIFIFKNIDNDNGVHYYCQYEISKHEDDNQFDIALPQSLMGRVGNSISHYSPATKEQCNLLFQKMKEAGYEWDDGTKELKKIAEEFQLKEGNFYECIKSYHYLGGGQYWFDGGKVYFCEKDGYLRSDFYHLIKVDDCENWQNYFRPYTEKLAWGEEDDCMINNIIDVLKPLSQTTHSDYAINSMINWLKSFKDRVQLQNHINTKCKYIVDDDLLRSAICD